LSSNAGWILPLQDTNGHGPLDDGWVGALESIELLTLARDLVLL